MKTLIVLIFLGTMIGSVSLVHAQQYNPEKDFENIDSPTHIWSDETFMYVTHPSGEIHAYNMTSKTHSPANDIVIPNSFTKDEYKKHPRINKDILIRDLHLTAHNGFWSDGKTIYFGHDQYRHKVIAYDFLTKDRMNEKDFFSWFKLYDYFSSPPKDVWFNGDGKWIIVRETNFVVFDWYSENRKQFLRLPGIFTTHYGVWSDGSTAWMSSSLDMIYSFSVSDSIAKTQKERHIPLVPGNDAPRGIWSDGNTMWVADEHADKLYAYDVSNLTAPGFEQYRFENDLTTQP